MQNLDSWLIKDLAAWLECSLYCHIPLWQRTSVFVVSSEGSPYFMYIIYSCMRNPVKLEYIMICKEHGFWSRYLAHLSWRLKWAFLIKICQLSIFVAVVVVVVKLFTFSSSQEPLGQFKQNLAQSILGSRGVKFLQMKGHPFLQGEIITKQQNSLTKFKNLLLKNHLPNFNQTWRNASLGQGD